MRAPGILCSLLCVGLLAQPVAAQAPPPEGPKGPVLAPPPAAPPPAAAPPAPAAAVKTTAAQDDTPAAPVAAAATDDPAASNAAADGVPALANGQDITPVSAAELEQITKTRAQRRESLYHQPSLHGATGLLRLVEAGSGRRGTFRFAISANYFSESGFLCPPCVEPNGGLATRSDDATRIGADLLLSATPFDSLEGYLVISSQSNTNNLGEPHLLQVVGDTTLGAKAFTPRQPDRLLSGGAAMDFTFLNGTGDVGISSANVAARALATVDFTNRSDVQRRLPLRLHGNLNYIFDNSADLIADTETARGQRISRIERFGLGINRVDTLQLALAAEGMWDVLRPFLEYSVDIPVNRQGYTCIRTQSYVGDACLKDKATFSSLPSRITFGSRVHVSALPGFALLGALDLALGGSSDFWEEMAPEAPYTLHLGISYAVDTARDVQLRLLPPPQEKARIELRIEGQVVQAGSKTPIAGALVRFEGHEDWTGLVTGTKGRFQSGVMPPGKYSLRVSAEGHRENLCSVTLQSQAFEAGKKPALVCELSELPRVGNIEGLVVDSSSGAPLEGAQVKIIDKLNRELTLATDARGAFRFERAPEGAARLVISANGYLTSAGDWQIAKGKDVVVLVPAHQRPKRPNVSLQQKAIRLRQPIEFEAGSANITRTSTAVVEEVAELLRAHPEAASVEIQVHTDDGLDQTLALNLTRDRANAVRDTLIRLGVDGTRLRAVGMGSSKPLAPDNSDRNRARNNRVEFSLEAGAAPAAGPALPNLPPP